MHESRENREHLGDIFPEVIQDKFNDAWKGVVCEQIQINSRTKNIENFFKHYRTSEMKMKKSPFHGAKKI